MKQILRHSLSNRDYEEEEESYDPDPNAVLSLGDDEVEYKKRNVLGKQRAEQLVPEGLLKRAQVLNEQVFIHQCNDCRETQNKLKFSLQCRMCYIVYDYI